ncbi:helix-turn-helix domain-containing protein [Promicromonospora sp. NPDC059942]|uniref:helix-turn-helix domain-containing protein n=1 Tax=Promicromonospora sp. NPDC059942 TaxID=3347009 RepID=UPI0036676F42
MARTNYDPLDRHPIFDGTLDPDLDDDATASVVAPRRAPTLYLDGLALVCAAAVRFEAARRGLSQRQIAAEVGLSRAAVSERFRGRTAWTLDQVGVLARLFGCEVAVLVTEPRKPVRELAGNYA